MNVENDDKDKHNVIEAIKAENETVEDVCVEEGIVKNFDRVNIKDEVNENIAVLKDFKKELECLIQKFEIPNSKQEESKARLKVNLESVKQMNNKINRYEIDGKIILISKSLIDNNSLLLKTKNFENIFPDIGYDYFITLKKIIWAFSILDNTNDNFNKIYQKNDPKTYDEIINSSDKETMLIIQEMDTINEVFKFTKFDQSTPLKINIGYLDYHVMIAVLRRFINDESLPMIELTETFKNEVVVEENRNVLPLPNNARNNRNPYYEYSDEYNFVRS